MTQHAICYVIIIIIIFISCAECGLAAPPSAGVDAYDKECMTIIEHAKAAARFHNQKDFKRAEASVAGAWRAFRAATEISPGDAQAYANMANFLHNSHKFEEAEEMWLATLKRAPREIQPMIQGRLKQTRFGAVSSQRDKEYAEGQGNITRTISLAQQQLALYANMPDILYDLATFHVAVSEVNGEAASQTAVDLFQQSQRASCRAWSMAMAVMRKGCDHRSARVVDANEWANLDFQSLMELHGQSGLRKCGGQVEEYGTTEWSATVTAGSATREGYSMRFSNTGACLVSLDDVCLSGGDGVILQIPVTRKERGPCSIWLQSAGYHLPVHRNVQLLAPWLWESGAGGTSQHNVPIPRRPPFHDAFHGQYAHHGIRRRPPIRVSCAAAVTQFAAASFYHFLLEVIPRIVFLGLKHSETLGKQQARLILPAHQPGGFMAQLLDLLPPQVLQWAGARSEWILYDTQGPPDIHVVVGKLYVVHWNLVSYTNTSMSASGSEPEAVSLPSLAPRSLLLLARQVFHTSQVLPRTTTVIWVSREGQSMRVLENEQALLDSLRARLPSAFEMVVWGGVTNGPVNQSQAMRVFASAAVVIGVHGGGLANILFCQSGAAVFELGFRGRHTRHYAHAAAALDLKYFWVPLQPDERGVGASRVSVEEKVLPQLVDDVLSVVTDPSETRAGEKDEL